MEYQFLATARDKWLACPSISRLSERHSGISGLQGLSAPSPYRLCCSHEHRDKSLRLRRPKRREHDFPLPLMSLAYRLV